MSKAALKYMYTLRMISDPLRCHVVASHRRQSCGAESATFGHRLHLSAVNLVVVLVGGGVGRGQTRVMLGSEGGAERSRGAVA